jgi:Palmitoyl protein thioesterase
MSKIDNPYYPIVYVRGYAMTADSKNNAVHDTYYGFNETSVELRNVPPPKYFAIDAFEGQLIKFIKSQGYTDEINEGLEGFKGDKARGIWICRFYDEDFIRGITRNIDDHARDLYNLINEIIPERLKAVGVDLGTNDEEYKVILIAHSMGGLVCRTLIQNIMPSMNEDPKKKIHRLVTMGSPHNGIDMGAIPDFVESFINKAINPYNAGIFDKDVMRGYLKIDKKVDGKYVYDANSLGEQSGNYFFPVKRCFCLIGSDHASYNLVKTITGNYSDGLVKQNNAFIVAGPRPDETYGDNETLKYSDENRSFTANVHRAHSGFKGIVNSYESYENIKRFLFGNIMAKIFLSDIKLPEPDTDDKYFYDFEFNASIKGTNVYLHRRAQDPCENAIRFLYKEIPDKIHLYTGFLNSRLRMDQKDQYSYFAVSLGVNEFKVKKGFIWDTEYPSKPVFNETLEIGAGRPDEKHPYGIVKYRWRSEGDDWTEVKSNSDEFYIPLRDAATIKGNLLIKAAKWPDTTLTFDE